jgi:hypothetical protein
MMERSWMLEWLKVALLCLTALVIYYLCWVRYPPRRRPVAGRWEFRAPDERSRRRKTPTSGPRPERKKHRPIAD